MGPGRCPRCSRSAIVTRPLRAGSMVKPGTGRSGGAGAGGLDAGASGKRACALGRRAWLARRLPLLLPLRAQAGESQGAAGLAGGQGSNGLRRDARPAHQSIGTTARTTCGRREARAPIYLRLRGGGGGCTAAAASGPQKSCGGGPALDQSHLLLIRYSLSPSSASLVLAFSSVSLTASASSLAVGSGIIMPSMFKRLTPKTRVGDQKCRVAGWPRSPPSDFAGYCTAQGASTSGLKALLGRLLTDAHVAVCTTCSVKYRQSEDRGVLIGIRDESPARTDN